MLLGKDTLKTTDLNFNIKLQLVIEYLPSKSKDSKWDTLQQNFYQ